MELTVLGCAGTYGAPAGGACSGYLIRSGTTAVWVDCGNGTLANLQQHVALEDLTAVVVSHSHADHCVDLCGLFYAYKYGLLRADFPVFAAPMVRDKLGVLVGEWGDTFAWTTIGEDSHPEIGGIRFSFSLTDHPVPTFAVAAEADGKRVVYSADTGPKWHPSAFDPADLLVIEASYQDSYDALSVHLSAREAGRYAREAKARKLMITHVWPRADPAISVAEAAEGYGRDVILAGPHLTVTV